MFEHEVEQFNTIKRLMNMIIANIFNLVLTPIYIEWINLLDQIII